MSCLRRQPQLVIASRDTTLLTVKMVGTDDRCIVGARVHAKATQVPHLAACSRRYGSNGETKRVRGPVVSVEWLYLPGKNSQELFNYGRL